MRQCFYLVSDPMAGVFTLRYLLVVILYMKCLGRETTANMTNTNLPKCVACPDSIGNLVVCFIEFQWILALGAGWGAGPLVF